ncbi:TraR/DksA C4-type zinc finger protein [Aquibacillus rhizosphaerae]|uniref:TraR/DksA C4-type zinc finger protein n=1 Tax=Aquibacillus rhizosphaerae TaxID=3051431 RepID=A0ABT7L0M6_9BACI|nr:TraR/DksA C4-type zinc finger protein [Aquibacillus sp. LR5S19]MDL4839324.1 TraR/DksA C4-type zinc finger protein [Aquibacillus sp. LR5S19]
MVATKVINEAKQILIQQNQNMLEHLKVNHDESNKEATGDLSNYDNHPGDQGTELYDQEKDIALNEHAKQKMKETNQALHAIENNTYGICEVCGKEIQEERLLAVPTTFRCQQHAEGGLREDRPVEEEIIEPDIIERDDKAEATESTGFDGKDAWQAVESYGSSETPSDFYEEQDSYDDMYIDSDELVGSSEEIEEVAKTAMDGKSQVNRNKTEEDKE